VLWRRVASQRMTPLINASIPGVVPKRSREARHVSAVKGALMCYKRLWIVPELSSAARMPLPKQSVCNGYQARCLHRIPLYGGMRTVGWSVPHTDGGPSTSAYRQQKQCNIVPHSQSEAECPPDAYPQ
jgi:hypothetical protein